MNQLYFSGEVSYIANATHPILVLDNLFTFKPMISKCLLADHLVYQISCSKSEYVRCLHFSREDSLYVATNNGYVYHAKLYDTEDVKWIELLHIEEEGPIVCMDLLSHCSDVTEDIENWIAVGNGKGTMVIARVVDDVLNPRVELTSTWSAEPERQLLGTYWCKSLGPK